MQLPPAPLSPRFLTYHTYVWYSKSMNPPPLTRRQEEVLRIVEDSVAKQGYVPTLREMAVSIGVSSLRTVRDHLAALERKGYLRRPAGRRRAINILRPIRPSSGGVPILGRVAAGRPILAVENLEGELTLAPPAHGRSVHFALRVKGDSMTGAGIQEGDFLIVRRAETAEPGEIVVALLGEEATVKRLRKKRGGFCLEAANPAYPDVPLDRQTPPARIIGRVVGLYRAV